MPPARSRSARRPGPWRWLRRIGWLVLIWAGSVGALGLVAWCMRLVMSWAGLTR